MRSGPALVAMAAAVIALGAIPVAAQQEAEVPPSLEPIPPGEVTGRLPIDDGGYTGTIGMGGVFWFRDESSGALVIWDGSGTGPMEFTVAEGQLAGTWTMRGEADIVGYGFPFPVNGTNTWTLEGSVSGSDPYRLTGSGSSSPVSAAGQEQSTTSPVTEFDVPLQAVVQVCDQVVGSWDQAVDAAFEDTPLRESLRTYFIVFALGDDDELQQRLDDIIDQAAEIQTDLSVPFLVIAELSRVLSDAEQLLSDLDSHPDTCPVDNRSFMRIITQLVGDVMNTFLSRWEGETTTGLQATDLQQLTALALRAGAIGAGAADRATAEHLQGRAEQLVQDHFDHAVAQDPIDQEVLQAVAVTATMLGYTFDSGVSGADICLVLGSC